MNDDVSNSMNNGINNSMKKMAFPVQSNRTLIKASIIALLTATAIFITIVLPSEYNIDYTGVGKYLGLTVLAEQQKVEQAPTVKTASTEMAFQKDEVSVAVPAGKGVEYKFTMQRYANLTYQWSSNGGSIYFDFHGEPKGDTTGYFESYSIATADKVEGSMTVPFDGVHGWYWKNKSDEDIIITLKTQGNYETVGLIQ